MIFLEGKSHFSSYELQDQERKTKKLVFLKNFIFSSPIGDALSML